MRVLMLLLVLSFASPSAASAEPLGEESDARALVQAAMDHWRGTTSYSQLTMTIHRPDWERTMSMRSWTAGEERSLVRVTSPAKDAGSGTLLDGSSMWTYAPKVNRIIKVPSSMMSQSWMGSDFSNDDVSRSTDIIDEYEHSLVATREEGGHTIHVVSSVPHEEAAVVWGREVLTIRDDNVLLRHEFFDQDGVLVKTMEALEIARMGGRTVAKVLRMGKVDVAGEWTEMRLDAAEFDIELPDNLFTLSNLRNPRQ